MYEDEFYNGLNNEFEVEKLIYYESSNYKLNDIIVREIKIIDQYSHCFKEMIDKYRTSFSICGYFVTALICFISDYCSNIMETTTLEEIILLLNDSEFVQQTLEEPMKFINSQRNQYTKNFPEEFKTEGEVKKYFKDLVANYEISDYLKQKCSQIENVIFFRQNSYNFPNEILKMKHEELKRLKEEKIFKEEKFIIETFGSNSRLMFLKEFEKENIFKKLILTEKALVFVADLLGHFVIIMVCSLRNNGKNEKNIILLNSIRANYIKIKKAEIATIASYTFDLNK